MATLSRSPLAPETLPHLPALAGVRMATAQAGIRYANRTDLLLMVFTPGTTLAGVFTRSQAPSAPVDWCRACLPHGAARALVVNSGNANAFTGRRGVEAVEATVQAVAQALSCAPHEVCIASTGVIGEPLPYAKIVGALPALQQQLAADGWADAARAIMTTDTFPKAAACIVVLSSGTVHIHGITKGSGMIAPDMATMLGFIATDAVIAAPMLQRMLQQSTAKSFNAITVDGDTSTSDTALLFATGESGLVIEEHTEDAERFQTALDALLIDLAKQIVMDGEGAQKLITIQVTGAVDDDAARRIGLAIGNSPLVKTAIAGEDANWGRIVMAVGKSGERVERDLLRIRVGGVVIAEQGERVADFDEAPVAAHMKTRDIQVAVDIGLGQGAATVWSCDLTHGYIDINADYRS